MSLPRKNHSLKSALETFPGKKPGREGDELVGAWTKPSRHFLGLILGLASLVSLVVASRSAVRESGEFQYNSTHIGSVAFRDILNTTQCLIQGYNIYDPVVVQKFHLVCPYLPNSFVLFLPFAFLSLPLGRVLWLALNLFFTVFLARQISVLFLEKKWFLLVLALMVCSAPWGTLIHFGQYTLWSLFFFFQALEWDKENRPILSGLALVFCLLKYVFTVPMLLYFLVYRRSWKNVAVAAGIHAVIFGIFCVHFKMSPRELFLAPVQMAKTIGSSNGGYLDLFVFWSRLLGGNPFIPYLLTVLPLVGAWVWLLFQQRGKDDLGMMALTVMANLSILYHNIYDYVGVIFPLVWFLKKVPGKRDWPVMVVGAICLWVFYGSSHYFEFFPKMGWLMDFLKSDSYLLFLGFLWYLGLGCLFFQLNRVGPKPVRSSNEIKL